MLRLFDRERSTTPRVIDSRKQGRSGRGAKSSVPRRLVGLIIFRVFCLFLVLAVSFRVLERAVRVYEADVLVVSVCQSICRFDRSHLLTPLVQAWCTFDKTVLPTGKWGIDGSRCL